MDAARTLLRDVWGYDDFRGVQEQVRRIVHKRRGPRELTLPDPSPGHPSLVG
jgi:superfamily II DNA helicase RecQ